MFSSRYAIPIVTGLTVLGAVTAFAAGFNVTSDTVLSGNADVPSCNNSATVKYQTVYDDQVPGYKVATAFVTTASGCNGMSYHVSLTGAGKVSLAELTGELNSDGSAAPDFSSQRIPAASVLGVAVTIVGPPPES
jgi:hypothetical protein